MSHLEADAALHQQLQPHNAAEPLPLTLQTADEDDDGAGIVPTPFVVLGHQRTGTNLLCGRLFQCKPEIVMHNEMFDARHIWTYYRQALRVHTAAPSGAAILSARASYVDAFADLI